MEGEGRRLRRRAWTEHRDWQITIVLFKSHRKKGKEAQKREKIQRKRDEERYGEKCIDSIREKRVIDRSSLLRQREREAG